MYWLLAFVLYLVQPLDTVEQEKMANYMVSVNQKAKFLARPLVKAIYREASVKGLDPTVLAAIVFNESWFDIESKGTSRERGLWQIWPWASPALDIAWDELRKQKRIEDLPDVPWKRLRLADRWKASLNIDIGTYLATNVIQIFQKWCLRKRHDRRRPTDNYAHYNSGYRMPRADYSYKLWKRTKRIRRVIGRPILTPADYAFLNRVVVQIRGKL